MIDLLLIKVHLQHFLMIECLIYHKNVKILKNVLFILYVHGYQTIDNLFFILFN